MKYLKNLLNSKTRTFIFAFDALCHAIICLIAILILNTFGVKIAFTIIALRFALFMISAIVFRLHNNIDSGFETLIRSVITVFVTSGVSLSVFLLCDIIKPELACEFFVPDIIALLVIYIIRAMYSYYIHEYKKQLAKEVKHPTLIVGAGTATRLLLGELEAINSKYYPECLVDDDVAKLHTKLMGVPIVGTIDDIPAIVEKRNIHTIIISIPSAEVESMNRIIEKCTNTHCFIRTLPSVSELIEHNRKCLTSMKDIAMEDLLSREPITVDTSKVQEMVQNKVCMVTGGGGSIGSELCRQIISYKPKKLVIVDIYENNAYDIQQELRLKYGAYVPLSIEIASVRDLDKMEVLFKKYKPNLVFHAAAHKHVPLMEYAAEEAVKNNVFGTYNMANLAVKHKVDRFLLISTDKAVNPTNVMGASKRCCEMVIKHFSNIQKETVFVTVRFGNVLGSNGSVVPLFEKQIQKGGPITITHPEITRYFMTIPEAVSLVLQAETMALSGQIFVLDMGKPVKIVTLAENLIKLCGFRPYKDIKIEFIGLREGEKLYEELCLDEEETMPTYNKKIFIGSHIALAKDFETKLEKLREYAENNDSVNVIKQLEQLVPTYSPDKRIH